MNPAPHVGISTEIEFNSKSHRVFDVSDDWIQGEVHDTAENMPIDEQYHPIVGEHWTKGGFSAFLTASGAAGTAPVTLGPLFIMTGADEAVVGSTSATYTWDDPMADIVALDIDKYIGNSKLVSADSSLGTMVLTCDAGKPGICKFDFDGIYTAPSEASGSAAISGDPQAVAAINLTLTLGGDTVNWQQFIVSTNTANNSPNRDGSSTGGVNAPIATNQTSEIEMSILQPAFSVANYNADFIAETKTAFSVVIGATAGNIITITADLYMSAKPEEIDINGVAGWKLRYRGSRTSGDTKLTIACT